jgi:hypothetical protein
MFLKALACGLSVIWAKTPSLQQLLILARDRNQILSNQARAER